MDEVCDVVVTSLHSGIQKFERVVNVEVKENGILCFYANSETDQVWAFKDWLSFNAVAVSVERATDV